MKIASTTASPAQRPPRAAKEEGKPKRNRCQRIAEVVDQIRQQRNAERP
jgi:hypothetical protein